MTRAYVVDRSFDGDRFTEVGRVSPDRSFGGRFVFTDTPIEGEVVYYRVRQLFVNGGSKTSGTVKSGLADVMESGLDQPTLIVSNFPNPFRQSTSVRYEIPNEGPVEVSVWDLSGQPVITLVDNVQAAGAYETLFSAGDLSAGTYFVRIQQGSQIKSHKLLLVK
jgi:hypothetical protein